MAGGIKSLPSSRRGFSPPRVKGFESGLFKNLRNKMKKLHDHIVTIQPGSGYSPAGFGKAQELTPNSAENYARNLRYRQEYLPQRRTKGKIA
jgi:hypothetical protein